MLQNLIFNHNSIQQQEIISNHSIHLSQKIKSKITPTPYIKWTKQQDVLYIRFLKANIERMKKTLFRKPYNKFKKMSEYVTSKDSFQCRSHHQKMMKKYGQIQQIIQNLSINMQNYHKSKQNSTDQLIQGQNKDMIKRITKSETPQNININYQFKKNMNENNVIIQNQNKYNENNIKIENLIVEIKQANKEKYKSYQVENIGINEYDQGVQYDRLQVKNNMNKKLLRIEQRFILYKSNQQMDNGIEEKYRLNQQFGNKKQIYMNKMCQFIGNNGQYVNKQQKSSCNNKEAVFNLNNINNNKFISANNHNNIEWLQNKRYITDNLLYWQNYYYHQHQQYMMQLSSMYRHNYTQQNNNYVNNNYTKYISVNNNYANNSGYVNYEMMMRDQYNKRKWDNISVNNDKDISQKVQLSMVNRQRLVKKQIIVIKEQQQVEK